MRRTKRTLIALAFTLVSCSTQVVPAATPRSGLVTLRVYATTATTPLLYDLTSAYRALHSHVVFEVAEGGYRTVSEWAAADEGAYFFSHHLPDDIDSPGSRFWAAPVGQDALTMLVSAANPVTNVSLEQVRDIFSGRVGDWATLGGEPGSIVVVTRESGSSLRAEFDALVIGDREITSTAQLAPGPGAMVELVARQPGAIGFGSVSDLGAGVRALAVNGILPTADSVYDRTYPLRTTLYIIGQREPMDDQRDMRAFIGWVQSPEGQAVVGQRYVPLLRP